jgi:hypothetical protein
MSRLFSRGLIIHANTQKCWCCCGKLEAFVDFIKLSRPTTRPGLVLPSGGGKDKQKTGEKINFQDESGLSLGLCL